jgi:hypothetical protein
VRNEVQTGATDGAWIEITNHRPYRGPEGSSSGSTESESWVPVNGSEQIATGDLHALNDGEPVTVMQ